MSNLLCEEAVCAHNKSLVAFLQRCTKRGVKLAVEKLQLCLGHYATNSGLKVHPDKVRAILEMPCPTDVKSLLHFNGTVQYLAKFLPCLSEMSHPLRQLTVKNAEWIWSDSQEKAWNDIKSAITQAPVLCYYSLNDEVTLQCDASDTGLGAALLQLQQSVSFSSRALTLTETRYAQIEKELLTIVFSIFLGVTLSTWKQTTSPWRRSLRRVSVMHLEGCNGCFFNFSITILTSSTRKGLSCILQIP